MPRKWKNSDESTFFTDKAVDSRLDKLRYELIKGYSNKKDNKRNNRNNYRKGPKQK